MNVYSIVCKMIDGSCIIPVQTDDLDVANDALAELDRCYCEGYLWDATQFGGSSLVNLKHVLYIALED